MIIEANSPEQMNNLSNEKKKNLVLILFYATWCGHCQDFEEHWEKLKNNHPEEVHLAQVESEDYNNYIPSENEEQIRGYPTIRLYHKDKMIKEYDGERHYQDVYDFLENYIKETNAEKNNMLIIKARKGNTFNNKLLEELRTGYKKSQTKRKRSPSPKRKQSKKSKKGNNGKANNKKNKRNSLKGKNSKRKLSGKKSKGKKSVKGK